MMGEGLGLKGIELLVFAHAYSYYRQGKEMFISEGNLGRMIGHSRKHVGAALARLCEKKLLIRSEAKHPGHQTYSYSVCEEEVRPYVSSGCDIRSQQDETKRPIAMGQKVTPPCNLSSHDNETYNGSDIKTNKQSVQPFNTKKSYGTQRNAALAVGHSANFTRKARTQPGNKTSSRVEE